MTEDSTAKLKNCLFILVSSYNTVLDRLDNLTDRIEDLSDVHERLIIQNEEAFKLAQEDFFRRLIEAEVNKAGEKQNTTNPIRRYRPTNESSRRIAFTITNGCQGHNQEVASDKR